MRLGLKNCWNNQLEFNYVVGKEQVKDVVSSSMRGLKSILTITLKESHNLTAPITH